MTDDPTGALISRLAAQDRAALTVLYGAVGAKLYGVVLHLLRDRAAADAAMCEAFATIWRQAGRFDPARDQPLVWLIGIARGVALDRLRSAQGQGEAPDVEPGLPPAGGGAAAGEVAQGGAQVVPVRRPGDFAARLAPERAEALRAAYLDGLSGSEVAVRAGLAPDGARTWLCRSLVTLREGPDP